MATSSIFATYKISTPEAAKAFEEAWDAATGERIVSDIRRVDGGPELDHMMSLIEKRHGRASSN